MYSTAILVCFVGALGSTLAAYCAGKGTVGQRMTKNLHVNDANADGTVTGIEIYVDFVNNYDINKDGCVSVQEWVSHFQSFYQFSAGFATKRLADLGADLTSACPVKYDSYRTGNISIPVDSFLAANVQSLIDYCRSDSSLLLTNCDCAQLTASCVYDPIIAPNSACRTYMASPILG